MIAYAAYIISTDGRPFVSKKFQSAESIPDDLLLGGLFTAIQHVTKDIIGKESEIESMKIKNFSYHFKSFGFFRVVIVTDQQISPETTLNKLGWRFMKQYGENIVDIGVINDNEFQSFKNVIQEIIIEDFNLDEANLINPTKKLNTEELYLLQSPTQKTAVALIGLVEGTIYEIAQESGLSLEETLNHIRLLQEKGFVGKKTYPGGKKYFFS